ncbi:phthiocerol/phthiodiolone dimycocerosyl transferase family protein [Nocardia farcinica]|uniref:phthiocerol/phthiodiolone dimycocerosyl transferase family protein n=1 Tax=Nocardia farcinica TaxID=37329 RepID=UPI002457DC59|nr:acyltransferase [Nocardia farcinica]
MWEEDVVVRELAPSEARFVRHGTYTGRSVVVRGELEIDALRAAFTALQREYPVLVCRIGEDGAGGGWLLRPIGHQGAFVRPGDVDEVRIPPEPMDPRHQLAYLDIIPGDDRSRVTLFVHHAVADAGHCIALFVRLWQHYTERVHPDSVTDGATAVVPHELPQSLEYYAVRRGARRSAISGLEEVTAPLSPAESAIPLEPTVDGPPTMARPERVLLDEASTRHIVAVGKHYGVSVNGLVTAALLRAYAAGRNEVEKGGAARGSMPLTCIYPVDLRNRFDPPVAAQEGTNMAGLAGLAAEIGPETGFVALAKHIATRLNHDLAEGVIQQSVLHFPEFFGNRRVHSTAGHVAITNTGRVPELPTPPGVRLTDYEIVYVSAHPRPSAGSSAAVTFLVYTFADRLCVGILGGGAAAAELPRTVARELSTLASEPIDV